LDCNKNAIAVAQFKGRFASAFSIPAPAKRAQWHAAARWPDRYCPENETANDHVLAGSEQTSCADVCQPSITNQSEIIDFDQGPMPVEPFLPPTIAV